MITYMSKDEVMRIHQRIMQYFGVVPPLINDAALESALMRPQMVAYYENGDIYEQAAVLMSGIVFAHAFLDGNKRTAMIAGITFLRINGQQITSDPIVFAQQIEWLTIPTIPLDEKMSLFLTWLKQQVQ